MTRPRSGGGNFDRAWLRPPHEARNGAPLSTLFPWGPGPKRAAARIAGKQTGKRTWRCLSFGRQQQGQGWCGSRELSKTFSTAFDHSLQEQLGQPIAWDSPSACRTASDPLPPIAATTTTTTLQRLLSVAADARTHVSGQIAVIRRRCVRQPQRPVSKVLLTLPSAAANWDSREAACTRLELALPSEAVPDAITANCQFRLIEDSLCTPANGHYRPVCCRPRVLTPREGHRTDPEEPAP
jgi:hypothetical protein